MLTSVKKRVKCGWLKENYKKGFYSPLKLQKFLFFYECFNKIEGGNADFSSLKGYANGPVFSDVYGDYFYEKDEFIISVEQDFNFNKDIVNEDTAKLAKFLVNILNEEELSDLTHEFNIWNAKEDLINRGVKHVSLNEQDLSNNDFLILKTLKETYTSEYIDSVEVLEFNDKSFLINKSDIDKITEEQLEIFINLSKDDTIDSPVYINLSEDGVILVD